MQGRRLLVPVIIAVVVVGVLAGIAFIGFRPSTTGTGDGTAPSNAPPVASFTLSSNNVYVGDSISVNATASKDPDGQIALYEWDWTSDGTFDGTGIAATHVYEQVGSYTITLRVTDNASARATASRSLSVSARPAEVSIVSHGLYVDTLGYAHVVGEVQWTGTRNIAFVELTATFRDSGGTVVAVGSTYTSISILTPNQKSPFEILEIDNVERIAGYTLEVTDFNPTTETPYRSFSVNDDSMYEDSIGYIHVVGTVTNIGSSTARYVEITVTFRDSEGNAVATTSTFTGPTDLAAGATGSFEAIHSSGSSWGSITAYDVQAALFLG